ncbi:MAG: hypothetical protein HPY53_06660 [Brevinematales bacterium]|nr:hypothetical protein [Brevinematales bacterium]
MNRILLLSLVLLTVSGNLFAKKFSCKQANLKVELPSGWKLWGEYPDEVRIISPKDEGIVIIAYYGEIKKDSTEDEEYLRLEQKVKKAFDISLSNNSSVGIKTKSKVKINGMAAYIISGYLYQNSGYEDMTAAGFVTGKGMGAVIVSIYQQDSAKFKKDIDKIIKSVKKMK